MKSMEELTSVTVETSRRPQRESMGMRIIIIAALIYLPAIVVSVSLPALHLGIGLLKLH